MESTGVKRSSFVELVLDQLADLPEVECRSMFGGYGLYSGDTFFGVLYKDTLYFRTDEPTVERYRAAGMQPFRTGKNQTLKHYYEVPSDVLENRETFTEWARAAVHAGESKSAR